MRNVLSWICLIFLFLSSCSKGKMESVFEAEDASFSSCQVVEVSNKGIASQNKAIGYLQKGSVISFGIKIERKEEVKINAVCSCPLSYDDSTSSFLPTSFVFSSLYLVTLNGNEVDTGHDVLSPSSEDVRKDNYDAFVSSSFSVSLASGDNVLSFYPIVSAGSPGDVYGSLGNFDCIRIFSSSSSLAFFRPKIVQRQESSYVFSLKSRCFYSGGPIEVEACSREGHDGDWIGLFRYRDLTFGPLASFHLDDIRKTYDFSSCLEGDLLKGSYQIGFFADDSYEVLSMFSVYVASREDDLRCFEMERKDGKILPRAKQREGHERDWIALYRERDVIGSIGSLYYYYPGKELSCVDILSSNPNTERKDMELTSGTYKLCYLMDDSYEELFILYFEV